MRTMTHVGLAVGLAWLGLSRPVAAENRTPKSDERASANAEPLSPLSNGGVDRTGDPKPLTAADLAVLRGGEVKASGSQSFNAVTSGNVLNGNVVGGSITLSENALSSFSGIGNFAMNTGAQVTLQSGMNVTINLAP